MGSMPYYRAHERGVKLIGATAHYATSDLDQGPIIGQDVMRVSHRDEFGEVCSSVIYEGAFEDRIIVHRNKCIVFAE